jgi:hypothetical protein
MVVIIFDKKIPRNLGQSALWSWVWGRRLTRSFVEEEFLTRIAQQMRPAPSFGAQHRPSTLIVSLVQWRWQHVLLLPQHLMLWGPCYLPILVVGAWPWVFVVMVLPKVWPLQAPVWRRWWMSFEVGALGTPQLPRPNRRLRGSECKESQTGGSKDPIWNARCHALLWIHGIFLGVSDY